MKKSILLVIALLTMGNFLFSSCSVRMFEGRAYVSGQHASREGIKAQARTSKQTRHFWF
jgi:hypothetical protein